MIAAIRLILINLCLIITVSAHAAERLYVVSYVYDGDTVKLRPINSHNKKSEFKLRLSDIDAPELDQDYGIASRRALMQLCQRKFPSATIEEKNPLIEQTTYGMLVTAKITGIDQYHRALGKLQCNQMDASTYLAEHGLAWHYAQYSGDATIRDAAANARRLRLGLWANGQPVPPWVWRHHHPPSTSHWKFSK